MNAQEFIDDFSILTFPQMRERYGLIFIVSIADLIREAKKREGGLVDLLVGPTGQSADRGPYFVEIRGEQFDVFQISDRGGRLLERSCSEIEEAAFVFFDRYLNSLCCRATDSRINAGHPEIEYLKKLRDEKLSRLRSPKIK